MKFYEIDNALQDAITAADEPIRLKIEIQVAGHFESVLEQDIIEANFYGLKEAAGGTTARGELLLEWGMGKAMVTPPSRGEPSPRCGSVEYTMAGVEAGTKVNVSFSMGEGLPYFQRFVFYIDDKGIQDVRGPGRKRYALIGLRDLSAKLRKTDESRDWTAPAVFTYSVVCDKSQPQKSLVHGIAQRAGLSVTDIDCSTIPVTLPYVKLRRDTWAELSSLATAYRCHLECAPEKPLVFAHSPYQTEQLLNDEISHTFTGEDIFYLRKISRTEQYRNTVRLKVNMPVSLARQEIWHYDDSPVLYDEFLQSHYPFKYPLVREIEAGLYEAKYKIKDIDGKERNVIYADELDTQEEAESRLEYDGGPFSFSTYDITTNHDKAVITLQKVNDGDLYRAAIYGRPIVLDINRSCFIRDLEAVADCGTVALNVTGSYFSEYQIQRGNVTIAQYEDWVMRELEERLQNRREFTVKTHRALFNARVGAKVRITTNREQVTGTITGFTFRYKKNKAFVSIFRIRE